MKETTWLTYKFEVSQCMNGKKQTQRDMKNDFFRDPQQLYMVQWTYKKLLKVDIKLQLEQKMQSTWLNGTNTVPLVIIDEEVPARRCSKLRMPARKTRWPGLATSLPDQSQPSLKRLRRSSQISPEQRNHLHKS